MSNFINSYQGWLEEYKKDKYQTWIRAILSDNQEVYLRNYNEWLELKNFCKSNELSVDKIGLQYKSNSIEIDTKNTDGVYLTKSIFASFGQQEKQTYTVGKVYGSTVKKTIWIIPELIQQLEEEDPIEQCFEEAIIYNYAKSRQTRTI
jgi:hypothetical protein